MPTDWDLQMDGNPVSTTILYAMMRNINVFQIISLTIPQIGKMINSIKTNKKITRI